VCLKNLTKYLNIIIRVCLGITICCLALAKLRQPYEFLSYIYQLEITGPQLGMLGGMVLPWAEVVLSTCLIGGLFLHGALFVCMLLYGIYIACIASAICHKIVFHGYFWPVDSIHIGTPMLLLIILIFMITLLGYIYEIKTLKKPKPDVIGRSNS